MARPWAGGEPGAADRARYAEAAPRSFWLDDVAAARPERPPLAADLDCDLCIVGGGYTGLWAALAAAERDPGRSVVVLEATRVGDGASGRNGGFLSASLTHGIGNGLARFPEEMATLERLALANYEELRADLERFGVECDFEPSGHLSVALEPHELEWVEEEAELLRRFGHRAEVLDGEDLRSDVASPTYLGATWDRTGAAIVHPAKLVVGLAAAAERAGVRICERSAVAGLAADGGRVRLETAGGTVRAAGAILATSAYRPPLRRLGAYIAPVYDYALMTEPLRAEQLDSIGWSRRQGIGDMGNQFHYYRLSADDRILFGGYDAVYRHGGPVADRHDLHDPTFARLSRHFALTFPQLAEVRFSHRWGGAIDTCSRFSAFFGTALGGRLAYALGYTGLGVGSTRWGARVALDLLDGRRTEATELAFVRRKPLPFPPEPLRSAVIQLTRNRLAMADQSAGRRGLWLRTLDRLGLGFDS